MVFNRFRELFGVFLGFGVTTKVSDTGLGGKRLASRDGVDEFHHSRNLIL